MTIEVRQLVIRSSVDSRQKAPAPPDFEPSAEALERMKSEILSECRELLREKLQDGRER